MTTRDGWLRNTPTGVWLALAHSPASPLQNGQHGSTVTGRWLVWEHLHWGPAWENNLLWGLKCQSSVAQFSQGQRITSWKMPGCRASGVRWLTRGAPGIVLCVLFDRSPNRIPTLGTMVALPWECEASTDEPVTGAGHAFTETLWVPLGAKKDWKGEGLLYSVGDGDTRKCWTWGRSWGTF